MKNVGGRATIKHRILPIFIPHAGCPYGCIFCNQMRITGRSGMPAVEDIERALCAAIDSWGDAECEYREVAFYGGSFTALPTDLQERLLAPVTLRVKNGDINGIRCSTRPDAIDENIVSLLSDCGVSTVELGVQSMNDGILAAAKRGHTAADAEHAVALLRTADFVVGVQLMPGLPGETWNTVTETIVRAAALRPDIMRIYPTLVIEDTELADMWRAGRYEALSHETAIAYASFMKRYAERKGIRVIRTGLQATEELDEGCGLSAGPYSPALGEEAVNRYVRDEIVRLLSMHEDVFGGLRGTVEVSYPRRLTSKILGQRNSNRVYWQNEFPNIVWSFTESDACMPFVHVAGIPYCFTVY